MGSAGTDNAELVAAEARLARAAASGDGDAFATLYERYAQRAYNLAFRICNSEEDAAEAVQEAFISVMRRLPELEGERELAFGSYLFTATRNATYDGLRRAQRTRPSDAIPEGAVPIGAGAGGLGLDPGDPEEDPDRRQLLAAQQEEIREANARLPERQREALALRELEDLSYDEIAELMEMNRNSVAQLISRARINLRDELRGTALASIVAASPECERALPLLASRDDDQLELGSEDGDWLAGHLVGCDRCRLAAEAMEEVGASYRAWIPLAVAPVLLRETMAHAAQLTGSDWTEAIDRHAASPPDPAAIPGMPAAYGGAASPSAAALAGTRGGRVAAAVGASAEDTTAHRRRRRRLAALLAIALLLLAGGVVAIAVGGGGEAEELTPAVPEAEADPAPDPGPVVHSRTNDSYRSASKGKESPTPAAATPVEAAAAPAPLPVQSGSGGSGGTKKGSDAAPSGQSGGVGDSEPTDRQPEGTTKELTPPADEPAPVEEPPPVEEPAPEEPTGVTDPNKPPGGP